MQDHQQQSIPRCFRSHSLPFRRPSEAAPSQCVSNRQLEAGFQSPISQHTQTNDVAHDTQDEEDTATSLFAPESEVKGPSEHVEEARNLVRTFTGQSSSLPEPATEATTTNRSEESSLNSNESDSPAAERHLPDVDYVPAPKKYRPSVFGAFFESRLSTLQSYDHSCHAPNNGHTNQRPSAYNGLTSATATPNKGWYEQLQHAASTTSDTLPKAGVSGSASSLSETYDASLTDVSTIENENDLEEGMAQQRSCAAQDRNNDVVAGVANILARRRFLIKLCDAFMKYGAPTHRLEDYLKSASRALEIDANFMYIPGAMTCTFKDNTLQTNTIEMIRGREGLDFGRLKDAFDVYKSVIHESPNASERSLELNGIENRVDEHTVWFRILMFGVSSVIVGPFSFQARPIDFVPIFFLGCGLGFLQLKVVPRSEHFSNVFEVSAAVVTAFAARGLGSIGMDGQYLFCFSATAQSSIALILPGFMILNSALELQGQSVVAGSVRMIYSVIYVLFLGFGLLLGMTLYGLIDRHAVTDTTCHIPTWFEAKGAQLLYTNFMWVPLFACSLALIYGARWSQLPVMAFVSVCGYQAYYWMSTILKSNPQIANAIGAFVIGCVANLYSRIFRGPAATTMLPAIYCIVPGGLASSGSLVAGVQSSEQIVNSSGNSGSSYSGTMFNVGSSAIQMCIGTSVGLYLSALVVYPYGKRRSGLFSFS